MPKPLEGVRILDFTWLGAGARGPRHLAGDLDFGERLASGLAGLRGD